MCVCVCVCMCVCLSGFILVAATPFPGLLQFAIDPYLIMLSVKQGGFKYYF